MSQDSRGNAFKNLLSILNYYLFIYFINLLYIIKSVLQIVTLMLHETLTARFHKGIGCNINITLSVTLFEKKAHNNTNTLIMREL